jgi:hypothetical protein
MSLTNRILIGMLGGILLGSLLNLIAHGSSSLDPDLRNLIENGLVNGVFDVVGADLRRLAQTAGRSSGVCLPGLWLDVPWATAHAWGRSPARPCCFTWPRQRSL